jgi:hypothetical protein
MGEKIDLFETLVKFLAVKPLKLEKFDLDEAKEIIKEEKKIQSPSSVNTVISSKTWI